MENQHREIQGYRELSPGEIAIMNDIKQEAEKVRALLDMVAGATHADQRCVAIARTEAQTAFMWAVRAIARPTTF